MGHLEKESARRMARSKIQKAILGTIAAAGLVSVAVIAPNTLQALRFFGIEPKSKWQKYNLDNSIQRLKKKGLICFESGDRGTFIRLTPAGEEKLKKLELSDYKITIPRKWDKKWRVLIFDIKEKRKATRDKIRLALRRAGLLRLQDSVWVYPYDFEDFMTLIKADLKVGKDVLYMIVDSIEGDKHLKEHFKLNT